MKKNKIKLNLEIALKTAKNAKDLTLITKEAFAAQFPDSSSYIGEISYPYQGKVEKPELPSDVVKIYDIQKKSQELSFL